MNSPLNISSTTQISHLQPIITTTSSGTNDTLEPGKAFTLGVTVTNPDHQQALDVDVALEGLPPDVTLSSQPMRPRLALLPKQSEEVTFTLKASPIALPRVITYHLKVTAPDQDGSPLESRQRHLCILPVDHTEHPSESPTFHFEPATSSTHPLQVQPLSGAPIQVWVDNRSDLVDRFRLNCEGLPKDWEVSITYPQDALGLGLMVAATNVGLNPGDRGQILLMIKPPAHAQAGVYMPTLQLLSENQPDLKLLRLLYLEVPPTYLLQPSLQSLRGQFRQGSALFELQLSNNGNSPRDIELGVESLDESDRYDYQLKANSVKILPQTTQRVELEVSPKRKWRRPLYGSGHFSNFRLKLEDTENHPLTPETLQGNFTWLPRPWWQLLLCVLLALGLVGSAAGLIWWFLLRPPTPPNILSFEASDTSYSEANGEFAEVDFQIRHPERIQMLRLTGYNPDGKILSAPIEYNFRDEANHAGLTNESLPHGLRDLCNVQLQKKLLTCGQVHTGARLPDTYVFELAVLYEHKGEDVTLSERSSNVVIEPIPSPVLVEFKANQSAYLETGAEAESGDLNIIPDQGIGLNLTILNPQQLAQIKLVGKTPEGEIISEITHPVWQPDRQETFLETDLGCKPSSDGQQITCNNLPTLVRQVGTFQFEVTLIPSVPTPLENLIKATTDPITIHPIPTKIDAFTINGENAQPKYIIPIDQTEPGPQTPPGINFAWAVSGGSTLKVELLLPDPLTVNPQGSIFFPLTPGERRTITLQATDNSGTTLTRSVEIEAVDPTPIDPTDVAAAAATAAVEAMQAAEEDAAVPPNEDATLFGASSSVKPEAVSPTEQPPRLSGQ